MKHSAKMTIVYNNFSNGAVSNKMLDRAVIQAPSWNEVLWLSLCCLFDTVQCLPIPFSLEQPTLALRVPLFLLRHFQTDECEVSDFA